MIEKIKVPLRGNILEKIDLSLTPYIREPLTYVGDSRVHWIGIIAATQSAKSVFLQGVVADAIDQDPGPLLYLFPDEKSGKKQLKEKIIGMIEKSEFLTAHKTSRVFDISKTEVFLDNMTITPGWAGSIATMSSTAYKRAVLDEVRLMPLTTGNESNAIKFSNDRLTTYFDMGLGQGYMVSSPSVEGDLLHEQLSVLGTLDLYWQVPCPHCGEYQELDFFINVKWDAKAEAARCLCRFCNGEFKDDDKKVSWNNKGVYAPKGAKIRQDGTLIEPYEIHERMFFHWSSLESPFRRFQVIWNEFLQTKNKLHDYKNFWQCWLAKFWIDDASKTSVAGLKERRSTYDKRDVPDKVKILTAGIDTQDDGFYVVVRGFGANKYTALVDEFFIACPIDIADENEIKNLLEHQVFDAVYNGGDTRWKISMVGIDTGGHRTKTLYTVAYNFPQLFLVKGRNNQDTTIAYSKEHNLYLVRTCEYLEETDIKSLSSDFLLPHNVSEDFCIQYCNIRKTLHQNKRTGEKKVEWKKVGRCDYRFADIHSFICLDIPTDKGVVRAEVEKEDFLINPYKKLVEQETVYSNANSNYEEQSDYHIGSFRW